MQRLTLRLIRTKGYEEQESKFISVDLPLDATESDLRLAFHHVETMVNGEGLRQLDAAAELVDSIVESRKTFTEQPAAAPPPTMDEQRAEVAREQAAYVQDAPAPATGTGQ